MTRPPRNHRRARGDSAALDPVWSVLLNRGVEGDDVVALGAAETAALGADAAQVLLVTRGLVRAVDARTDEARTVANLGGEAHALAVAPDPDGGVVVVRGRRDGELAFADEVTWLDPAGSVVAAVAVDGSRPFMGLDVLDAYRVARDRADG